MKKNSNSKKKKKNRRNQDILTNLSQIFYIILKFIFVNSVESIKFIFVISYLFSFLITQGIRKSNLYFLLECQIEILFFSCSNKKIFQKVFYLITKMCVNLNLIK